MTFTEDLIQRHEGLRLSVYTDTVGKKTIGYGFNLDAPGAAAICTEFGLDIDSLKAGTTQLTPAIADAIFEKQLEAVYTEASGIFSAFGAFPENAQAVIADLLFNLGFAGFKTFHNTIACLTARMWNEAADNLENSLWFKQTWHRATEDVALLRSI
jgi:GH24 family phage-related lysozyme (muramidase)